MYKACETCRFWIKRTPSIATGWCYSIPRAYDDGPEVPDNIDTVFIIANSYEAQLLTGAHWACDNWKPKS